jgi:hypothetical protein
MAMLSMTGGSPYATAFLRGLYMALGSGLVAFLPAWAVTDDLKAPIISGAMAALFALGFRGGFEGNFDNQRAETNDIRNSDVPVAAPDVTVTEPAKP